MNESTKETLKLALLVISIVGGITVPLVVLVWNAQQHFNETVVDLRESVHADMTALRESVHADTSLVLQRLTRVETIIERLDVAGPRNAENTRPKPAKPSLEEAKLDRPYPRKGETLLTSTAVD